MTLETLLAGVETTKLHMGEVEVKDVQFDSRKVTPGSLFVAEKGVAVDGHNFIGSAIEKGAVAIVAEHLPETLDPKWLMPSFLALQLHWAR